MVNPPRSSLCKRMVGAWVWLVAAFGPTPALDQIPETSGFSGFFLAAPGAFAVSSNLIYGGAPLLDDVAILCIFAASTLACVSTAPRGITSTAAVEMTANPSSERAAAAAVGPR